MKAIFPIVTLCPIVRAVRPGVTGVLLGALTPYALELVRRATTARYQSTCSSSHCLLFLPEHKTKTTHIHNVLIFLFFLFFFSFFFSSFLFFSLLSSQQQRPSHWWCCWCQWSVQSGCRLLWWRWRDNRSRKQ